MEMTKILKILTASLVMAMSMDVKASGKGSEGRLDALNKVCGDKDFYDKHEAACPEAFEKYKSGDDFGSPTSGKSGYKKFSGQGDMNYENEGSLKDDSETAKKFKSSSQKSKPSSSKYGNDFDEFGESSTPPKKRPLSDGDLQEAKSKLKKKKSTGSEFSDDKGFDERGFDDTNNRR